MQGKEEEEEEEEEEKEKKKGEKFLVQNREAAPQVEVEAPLSADAVLRRDGEVLSDWTPGFGISRGCKNLSKLSVMVRPT